MSTKFVPPSPRFPNGRILVVVRVAADKQEQSIDLPQNYTRRQLTEAIDRAKLVESELKIKMRVGNYQGELTTVKQVLEHYHDRSGHNPSVYKRLMAELGSKDVKDLWEGLEMLCDHMEDTPQRRGKGYEPATINRTIGMAKAACSFAHNTMRNRMRLLPQNYLSGFPLKEENNIAFRVLSEQERAKLWEKLPEHVRPLYYYACRVPIRLSEAISISKSAGHINQVAGSISLPDGFTKNGSGRLLPIPREFEPYFKAFMQNPKADYLFNMGPDFDFSPQGYWIKSREQLQWNWQHEYNALLDNCGIKGYNFHKTRQEAVLSLYQEGYQLEQIRYLGGWLSREAFMRYVDMSLVTQIDRGANILGIGWHRDFVEQLKVA